MQPISSLPEIQVSYHPIKVAERVKVCSSQCSYEVLSQLWNPDTILLYEEFLVLFLDRKNGVIGYRVMNRGSNCGTVVDIKLIFSISLATSTSSIILSHNHPSGNLKPSQEDIKLTNKIKDAGELLEIKLLDHLIVSDSSYLSFLDEGMI